MNELFTLQFLRPYWLLALLPTAFLLWKIWQIKQKQGSWHQIIAPQFRPLLLGESSNSQSHFRHTLALSGLTFIWLLAIIALAGPSTQTVEMPAQKNQQGTVIILDLSLSMLADDVPPSRLERAKYKITDLLTQHPELSVGLIGYANSAHTISPISEDNQTLLSLLPALNPVVMPSYGSNPILGFKKADALFKGSHINHGHIIWITDDIEPYQVPQIKQWIQQHDYSISILTVGTPTGGAVHIPNYGLLKDDNDNIILPPLPLERFNKFSELNTVRVSHLSTQDQSLTALMPPTFSQFATHKADADTENQLLLPLDQGGYLLLLLLPLVALLFRRGWVLSLSAISLPLVGLLSAGLLSVGLLAPNTSYAETTLPSLSEAFKSPDQQAYQAWQENNLSAAESLFENEQWRASTLYKQGKYQEAANLFRKDNSATGYYNLGNALAKSGELNAAKEAYEKALEQQPNFQKAQKNLTLIKQLLAKQKEEEQKKQPPKKDQDSPSKDQKDKDKSKSKNESGDSEDTPNKPEESKSQSDQQSSNKDQQKSKSDGNADHQKSGDDASDSDSEKSDQNQASNDLNNEPVPKSEKNEAKEGQDKNEPSNEKSTSESEETPSNNERTQDSNSSQAHQKQTKRDSGKLGEDEKNTQTNPAENIQPLTAKEQEQQRAIQNWLNQIPDEPGLFLKRKFEHQYQQQSTPSNPNSKQW